MTTRYRNVSARARILAALGVTSLVLAAASPASAISRDYEPTDDSPTTTRTASNTNEGVPVDEETGEKWCPVANLNGGKTYYPPGTVITVKTPDGRGSGSMKCKDGEWVAAFTQPEAGLHYEANDAYVDESGTLVLVNPHEQYTYSTSGGSYAQP